MNQSAFSTTAERTATVLRDVLTGNDRMNLIRYVNGESSELSRGMSGGGGGGGDPENAMIEVLDRARSCREVHRAYTATGEHGRTLTNAYLMQPTAPKIRKHFGELAGIAVWKVDDLERLIADCEALDRGNEDAKRAAKARTDELRFEAHQALAVAERAYVVALRAVRADKVVPTTAVARVQIEHGCRCSTVYSCPCRWVYA